MSKLSFRARAVDAGKGIPVVFAEEVPGLSEHVAANRCRPVIPTGMEKDEEREVHLRQAISAQQRLSTSDAVVIPVPKVTTDIAHYDRLYPADFKPPKQLIKVQAALSLYPETPDYDLDSEDERWLNSCDGHSSISPLQFEHIMDVLERSEFRVIQPAEAESLMGTGDEDVFWVVYDYWLDKKYSAVTQGRKLTSRVKNEKKETAGTEDPYVAFRRRDERVQTRRNRKNDEESYRKVLKLHSDIQTAIALAEMVKTREETKRELVKRTLDIAEKRFLLNDFEEESAFGQLFDEHRAESSSQPEKREEGSSASNKPVANKKRKQCRYDRLLLQRNVEESKALPTALAIADVAAPSVDEADEKSDRPYRYSFVRRRGCGYYAPAKEGNANDCQPRGQPYSPWWYRPTCLRSKHSAGSPPSNLRFVGSVRRRAGRGGRMLLDRSTRPVQKTKSADVSRSGSADVDWSKREIATYYQPLSFSERVEIVDALPVALTPPADLLLEDQQSSPFAVLMGPTGMITLPLSIGALQMEKEDPPQETDEAVTIVNQSGNSAASTLASSEPPAPLKQQKSSVRRQWNDMTLDDSGSTIELDLDDSASDRGSAMELEAAKEPEVMLGPAMPLTPFSFVQNYKRRSPAAAANPSSTSNRSTTSPLSRKRSTPKRKGGAAAKNCESEPLQSSSGMVVPSATAQRYILSRLGKLEPLHRPTSFLSSSPHHYSESDSAAISVGSPQRRVRPKIPSTVASSTSSAAPLAPSAPTLLVDHGGFRFGRHDCFPTATAFYAEEASASEAAKPAGERGNDHFGCKPPAVRLVELGYPLPTPSPSPGAIGAGSDELGTALDECRAKPAPLCASLVFGRLASRTLDETRGGRSD